MRLAFRSILTAVFLAMAGVAVAGPFEDGQAAYQRHDYATALQVWRPLADHGDANAQAYLAGMYANGQGVPQDYAEAVKWLRKAADQGFAPAQFNLGVMYDSAQGVPQDYAEAVKWYRKAADQGLALAQVGLGQLYMHGKGVPQDYVATHMWFNLAASRAEDAEIRDMAIKERDLVASMMTPAQIAEAQRMAREWAPK